VWTIDQFIKNASGGYVFKLGIALCLIPFIYLGHFVINRSLGKKDPQNEL
jgi:uncharacterized PurR-regulated membrane protein YhhQ (DUF165 family)